MAEAPKWPYSSPLDISGLGPFGTVYVEGPNNDKYPRWTQLSPEQAAARGSIKPNIVEGLSYAGMGDVPTPDALSEPAQVRNNVDWVL